MSSVFVFLTRAALRMIFLTACITFCRRQVPVLSVLSLERRDDVILAYRKEHWSNCRWSKTSRGMFSVSERCTLKWHFSGFRYLRKCFQLGTLHRRVNLGISLYATFMWANGPIDCLKLALQMPWSYTHQFRFLVRIFIHQANMVDKKQ